MTASYSFKIIWPRLFLQVQLDTFWYRSNLKKTKINPESTPENNIITGKNKQCHTFVFHTLGIHSQAQQVEPSNLKTLVSFFSKSVGGIY